MYLITYLTYYKYNSESPFFSFYWGNYCLPY